MPKKEDRVPDLYQGLLAIIEVIQETRRFVIDPCRADTDAIAAPNSGSWNTTHSALHPSSRTA